MNFRKTLKKLLPPRIINNTLLMFPFLYKTGFINYETNLDPKTGVQDLMHHLAKCMDIEGNIIECGSSRCGSSVIMAKYLKGHKIKKTIFACDSFEGFDLDELRKERQQNMTTAPDSAFTSTSYEYVVKKIKKLGVGDIVVPVKGFFQNTVAKIDSRYCFAFIDCDLQESLIFCAEVLFPRLENNGCMLFDDYANDGYLGARIGVDEFVKKHQDAISSHGQTGGYYYIYKK